MNSTIEKKTHTPSLIQFIFNALFLLGAWGMAVFIVLFGIVDIASNYQQGNPDSSLFTIAAALFTLGLAFIPSIFYSWKRMSGHPVQDRALVVPPFMGIFIALWPLLVYFGYVLPEGSYARLLLLPVIHSLSVVIPIFGLLWLGCNRLMIPSYQRNAGLFSSGIILGTNLSMIAEIVLIVIGLVVLVVVMVAFPDLGQQLSDLANQINAARMDPDSILQIIQPFITSPIVIAIILGFISVATPLIEEICKPLGLWFFAKRGLTPIDGFVGGMLSGAAFTLVETLFNGIQNQPDAWLLVITMRVGTGALHIFASGWMGYSMAKAWSTRNYWHLLSGYLISVSLHGLWNAFAILLSITQAIPPEQGSTLEVLGKVSPYGMAFLAILFIAGLSLINRKFRSQQSISMEINTLPVENG